MIEHNIQRASQLVKESGYDGRPIVLLHVTDIPIMNGAAIVARQRLERVGFKVLLRGMNWAAHQAVRANKDPPSKGGWNLIQTWWQSPDVSNPAVHFGISGAGEKGWFGWPDIPRLENLITDWVRAPDEVGRHSIAEQVQKVAMDEVPYVPWGEYVAPWACRKNLRDFVRFGPPVFWNVKVT